MSTNDDYTGGNLLYYLYHQKHYKFIGINLLRQANINIPQQINFIRKLKENDSAVIFFIAEIQQKTAPNFF